MFSHVAFTLVCAAYFSYILIALLLARRRIRTLEEHLDRLAPLVLEKRPAPPKRFVEFDLPPRGDVQ